MARSLVDPPEHLSRCSVCSRCGNRLLLSGPREIVFRKLKIGFERDRFGCRTDRFVQFAKRLMSRGDIVPGFGEIWAELQGKLRGLYRIAVSAGFVVPEGKVDKLFR